MHGSRRRSPDIVCLQETKCPDEQFPALALQAAGYDSAYHGEKSYNGVAILSKTELRDVRASLCDEVVDPQARVIAATVGDVRVYSIYAPNGQAVGSPAYEYKLELVSRACAIASRKKRLAISSCAAISTSRRRMSMFTIQIFGAARSCVRTANVPRFRTLRNRLARHTAIASQGRRTFQLVGLSNARVSRKIAACASTRFWPAKTLAKKCTAAGIDREMRKGKEPSDHAPVWAEFEL